MTNDMGEIRVYEKIPMNPSKRLRSIRDMPGEFDYRLDVERWSNVTVAFNEVRFHVLPLR